MIGLTKVIGLKKILLVGAGFVFMILLDHVPLPGSSTSQAAHATAPVMQMDSSSYRIPNNPVPPSDNNNGGDVFAQSSAVYDAAAPQYDMIKYDIDTIFSRIYHVFTFLAFIGCCFRIGMTSVWDGIFLGKREAPIVALISVGPGIFVLFIGPLLVYVMILLANWVSAPLLK